MNKKKLFLSSILGLCFALGLSSNAYAKVNSYVLKDNVDGVVRNYISEEVNKSLINRTLGKEASLFDEFEKYLSKNGIFAFHSDTGKFVSSDIISKELKNSNLNNKVFSLDKFMEDKNTPSVNISEEFSKSKSLGIVKKGLIIDKNLAEKTLEIDRDLFIMADNIDIKDINIKGNLILEVKSEGNINLSNISCKDIKVNDAGKGSINLTGVKANQVKIIGNAKVKADTNTKVEKLEISPLDKNSEVSLEGNFALVEVNKEAKINLSKVTIDKFEVKAKIEYKLDKDTKIKELLGDQDKIKGIKDEISSQSGQTTPTPGGTNGGNDSGGSNPGGNNPGGSNPDGNNPGGNDGGNPGGEDNQSKKVAAVVKTVQNGIEVTITINNITDDVLTLTIEDSNGVYKYIDQIDKASIIGGKATIKLQLGSGEYKATIKGQAFGKEEVTIK